jgi:hypothetical protein
MTAATLAEPTLESVESLLREDLVRAGAALSTTMPILRHLLATDDQPLLSDEAVARARGMLTDLARQLLHAQADAARIGERTAFVAEHEDALVQNLAAEPALLTHVHSLTIEGKLALQLQVQSDIDPVLCPQLQDMAASPDDAVVGSAMAVLAAQARFIQHHRRMALPLGELPGDLFHSALLTLRAYAGEGEGASAAERALRNGYDEGRSRLGLIQHLVTHMGRSAQRALDVESAGVAIFTTALSMASGQDRDLVALSFSERQFVRLALAMRAAGLKQPAVEEQFLYLHPGISLPAGFDQLTAERSAALLAQGA